MSARKGVRVCGEKGGHSCRELFLVLHVCCSAAWRGCAGGPGGDADGLWAEQVYDGVGNPATDSIER